MNNSPKYPNQQLKSVSLETYFPGRLGLFSALGQIQAQVEERLPNLFVPNVKEGEASALRPFQMRDSAGHRSLAVAVNQASFLSFKYPGYEAFAAEAVPVLQGALGVLEKPRLNRVVYRYENELGLSREDSGIEMAAAAFPGIAVPVLANGALSGPLLRVNATYEHAWQRDGLGGSRGFHARVEEAPGMPVFRVTVFASVEDCNCDVLRVAADAAHAVSVELFEALISESFRKFISVDGEE